MSDSQLLTLIKKADKNKFDQIALQVEVSTRRLDSKTFPELSDGAYLSNCLYILWLKEKSMLGGGCSNPLTHFYA